MKRRSTAQGLAQRARIVLACADGGSNVAVAARLRVRPRDGCPLAAPVPGKTPGRADRRAPPRRPPLDHRRPGRGRRRPHPGRSPGRLHALVQARTRPQDRHLRDQRAADLAVLRPAALAHRDVQGLPRPAPHRQDPRRRRHLPEPAAERGRLQRGRETPDPGPGTHRPGAADAARSTRAAQLRLRAARHHRPVRRPRHRQRQDHQQALSPAHGRRLPRLPGPDRPARSSPAWTST